MGGHGALTMAMGLPAIVTNWSGLTAFISSSVAYPLEFEMGPCPTSPGRAWAEPSLTALRRLMRHVVSHPDEAAALGAAASAHVARHFSQPAVVDRLVARLQHLEPMLLLRRVKEA